MDKDVFVQKVKMLCLQKGVKPTNACKECGIGGSFLSDISRGQVPSVERVQILASYLGVTTSELLGEEKEPAPEDGDGLNEEQQELVSLYKTAPSVLRRATLEMLRSAVRQGVGVSGDPLVATVKGVSGDPLVAAVKGMSGDPLIAEVKVVRNSRVKKLPYGKVAVRSKKGAKPRGKPPGGSIKGK